MSSIPGASPLECKSLAALLSSPASTSFLAALAFVSTSVVVLLVVAWLELRVVCVR